MKILEIIVVIIVACLGTYFTFSFGNLIAIDHITDVNGELTYTMYNNINPQITVTDKDNFSKKIIDPPFLNYLKISPIFPLFIWSIGIGVFILNEYTKLKKSDQIPTLWNWKK